MPTDPTRIRRPGGELRPDDAGGPSAEWLSVLVGLIALVLLVGLAWSAAPGHAPAGRSGRWPVRRPGHTGPR